MVDAVIGSDSTPCCGFGGHGACQTLGHGMALIDAAQAKDVNLLATVDGGGGDWAPSGESYPVVLGWGVELSAPGVYFPDPKGSGNAAILDVDFYSSKDTIGYASIVGSTSAPIGVGMNAANTLQTSDVSTLAVESGNTLYLANASVNSSLTNPYSVNSILVQAGATLWLGQDQSNTVIGTVTIGNSFGELGTDGFQGIVCAADYAKQTGCTVLDNGILGLQSSVIIQGQALADILAVDFAYIALGAAPKIGVPPNSTGFLTCPSKDDASREVYAAVEIMGAAQVIFFNGTVQCIGSTAFETQIGDAGTPFVNVDSTLIRNTDLGFHAAAGQITFTYTRFEHNWRGVWQDDGGIINLAGIGLPYDFNTVICSSAVEASHGGGPGVDVYNTSANMLNASNLTWDTPGPDYFSCDSAFQSCSCNLASCTLDAGSDGMDAVEDSTNMGGIITTNNSFFDGGC
jgi:hypothetical protein